MRNLWRDALGEEQLRCQAPITEPNERGHCGNRERTLWLSRLGVSVPKSIMIFDDNEIIRHKLRLLLKANDDWTICAEAINGRDAVEKAQRFHPDFVVLDYCMPTMDGLEAAPMPWLESI